MQLFYSLHQQSSEKPYVDNSFFQWHLTPLESGLNNALFIEQFFVPYGKYLGLHSFGSFVKLRFEYFAIWVAHLVNKERNLVDFESMQFSKLYAISLIIVNLDLETLFMTIG